MTFTEEVERYFDSKERIAKLEVLITKANTIVKELAHKISYDISYRTSEILTEMEKNRKSAADDSKRKLELTNEFKALKNSLTNQLKTFPEMDFRITPPFNQKPYTVQLMNGEIIKTS